MNLSMSVMFWVMDTPSLRLVVDFGVWFSWWISGCTLRGYNKRGCCIRLCKMVCCCVFLRAVALFCAFFLTKTVAKKCKSAQNSAKTCEKRFCAIPPLIIPPFACHRDISVDFSGGFPLKNKQENPRKNPRFSRELLDQNPLSENSALRRSGIPCGGDRLLPYRPRRGVFRHSINGSSFKPEASLERAIWRFSDRVLVEAHFDAPNTLF